jgi:hypothetical protein
MDVIRGQMMKRIVTYALLFFIGGFSAFGQLVSYPDVIHNGTGILDGGVGFGGAVNSPSQNSGYPQFGNGWDYKKAKVPPFFISADFAVPVAAMPFTLGFETAISSEKGVEITLTNGTTLTPDISLTNLCFAFRLGYHVDFSVKNLDTYALLKLGYIRTWGSFGPDKDFTDNNFWFGIGVGARYFFLPQFGTFAELGIDTIRIFSFGVSFNL